ncbi:hypothetical protein ACLIBG_08075 [Virgibacillus sp. W0181]|uniref:hypothetical protein n=1 Tax=Virgibacillus sp. W0181 TaxID=3391581 RepID=UPI003F4531A0
MKKDKFYIDFPDEQTIHEQINYIVSTGMPVKISFFSYLKQMYKQIGLKFIFRDAMELFYITVLLVAVFVYFSFKAEFLHQLDGKIHAWIFIFSPIIYLTLSVLSLYKLKQNNTYEVEMTCKYNVFQLAAFRMLVFSLICLGINGIIIGVLSVSYQKINFLQAFSLSTVSLFLFSTAFLFALTKMQSNFTKYSFIFGWLAINFLFVFYSKEVYKTILINIPMYIYIGFVAVFVWLYIKNLKKLITYRNSEGVV